MSRILAGLGVEPASAQRADIDVDNMMPCDQDGPLLGLDCLDRPDRLARSTQRCLFAKKTGSLPHPLSQSIDSAEVFH